jgi:hypothetical protein
VSNSWTKVKTVISRFESPDEFSMNRDSFLETLLNHYADEIQTALSKCKHGDSIDYPTLTHLLLDMGHAARGEGLGRTEFENLVRATLPGVWDNLETQQKAA